jgi:alkylated DNA repair dioxygenase AlkB
MTEKPDNILYLANALTENLETEAISVLENLVGWRPIAGKRYKGTKEQRLGYGRKHQEKIPEVLIKLATESLKILLESHPELFENNEVFKNFSPETLVINRYNIGEKCGAHHDPPRENPLVIGITIQNSRTMRWRKDTNKSVKYDILTEPRSVYCFWGDAFNCWTHESVASKKQKGVVFSLTFRKERVID